MRLSLLLLSLLSFAPPASAQDSLLLVVRVDDILSRSSIASRSLVPFEAAVEARGGKVTWAVIPGRLTESQNRDGVLAAELRKTIDRGHEVSLHGFSHICQRCRQSSHEMWCTTHQSAFTPLQQSKLLDDGLAILQDKVGVRPTSFVPPGYVADSTTYRLLGEKGMPWISTAGEDGAGLHPSLFNVVRSEDFNWAIDADNYAERLTDVLADVRTRAPQQGHYVLVLHDPFTRPGYANGISTRWVGEVLDSLNVEYEGRIRYRTLSQAAASLSTRTTDAPPVQSLTSFAMGANTPNPFSQSTTFHFSLGAPTDVLLTVHDLLGRHVATVLDGYRAAGSHSVPWTATDLPAGVYLYRLSTVDAARTSRLVLAR